jgi:nicotinamidase/pyrazinamidase
MTHRQQINYLKESPDMTTQKIHLLAIDPQNDFCDIPAALQPLNPLVTGERIAPALPVPGAHDDMIRLSALIDRLGSKLYDIHVTMDSHNPLDIAHPTWWRNEKGDAPAPFTLISVSDVRNGVWRARNPLAQAHSLKYVETLEANGRYVLIIWPEHCLIGQWGHNVHASVANSLNNWARNRMDVVDYVTKGSNALTEHYSAVQAEMPDASDPSTMLNSRLIKVLAQADIILIAGEALSHCVASTVRDVCDNFGDENIKKLILLTDCSSSVAGFEALGSQFVTDMKARGMQTALSTDFLV